MTNAEFRGLGPILFARGATTQNRGLVALMILPAEQVPPLLEPDGGTAVAGKRIYEGFGQAVWRYPFSLPACEGAGYAIGGERFEVASVLEHDVRIAYAAGTRYNLASGTDSGQSARDEAMWRRLAEEHEREPFVLLLHGGNEIEAHALVDAHPRIRRWRTRKVRPYNDEPFTPDMAQAAEAFLLERYLGFLAEPSVRYLSARVPSLAMWGSHDIFEGWGRMEDWRADTPVGEGLYAVARRLFLIFQMGEEDTGTVPFACPPPARSLSFGAQFPGFRIVGMDLSSERTAHRFLGKLGWDALETALRPSSGHAQDSARGRVFVLSEATVLGPRLGLSEKLLPAELRDHWHSRGHGTELNRLLNLCTSAPGLTVLSGGQDVSARAILRLTGEATVNQLVSASISQFPIGGNVRRLALVRRLVGLSGSMGRYTRMRRLPRQRRAFVARRCFLVLERRGAGWSASWELEGRGRTPELPLEG